MQKSQCALGGVTLCRLTALSASPIVLSAHLLVNKALGPHIAVAKECFAFLECHAEHHPIAVKGVSLVAWSINLQAWAVPEECPNELRRNGSLNLCRSMDCMYGCKHSLC